MKKIKTLFLRDYSKKGKPVINEVNPDCQWVLDGEGHATEKFEGTACMWFAGMLWRRRFRNMTKSGKRKFAAGLPPEQFDMERDFQSAAPQWRPATPRWDGVTKQWPGWLPVDPHNPSDRYHRYGLEWALGVFGPALPEGTYELVGRKVQGNYYDLSDIQLWPHGLLRFSDVVVPRSYEGLYVFLGGANIEGVVWHHPDGRMAKIKRADFGWPWPMRDDEGNLVHSRTAVRVAQHLDIPLAE